MALTKNRINSIISNTAAIPPNSVSTLELTSLPGGTESGYTPILTNVNTYDSFYFGDWSKKNNWIYSRKEC